MMVNTLGIQEQERNPSRGNSRDGPMRTTMNGVVSGVPSGMKEFGDEDMRDYYGARGMKPKELKVDKELEKIYLQRQNYPKKAGQRSVGRSTSRDKL